MAERLLSYEESLGVLIETLSPHFAQETLRDTAETLVTVVSIRVEADPSNPEIIAEIGQKIKEIVESDSYLDHDPENPIQIRALTEAVLAKKKMEPWKTNREASEGGT